MIVHLNGRLVDATDASISPLDRGFIFGDAIYEGLRTVPDGNGARVVGLDQHIARMREGLDRMRCRWDPSEIGRLSSELVAANGIVDAFVYVQVSRGTPPAGTPARSRVPAAGTEPTVFAFCQEVPALRPGDPPDERHAITWEDQRWLLGRLKCTSLAANVIACQDAADQDCDEVVFVRDGLVAEGSATNLLLAIGDPSGSTRIVTPSLESAPILAGVTRILILEAVPGIEERPVAVDELTSADEIVLVGTTTNVASIVRLDGRQIGDGSAGPVAHRLRRALVEHIHAGA